MKKTEVKLGYWMAIISAICAIVWFITFNLKDTLNAVPDWKDLESYAQNFKMVRLFYIYPSLILAMTYLILLSSLYRLMNNDSKIWVLSALAIGVIYATTASINYNIQAVAVRASIAAEELGGIELFISDNPNSIFSALANSYVYMAISMALLGFAFTGSALSNWIKGILLVQAISAIGQVMYSMFDASMVIFITTSMIWVIGAPLSFFLIAKWIRIQEL